MTDKIQLFRMHTDALDEKTLQEIADRIHERNPNQAIYIYDIERDIDEIDENLQDMLHEKAHEPDCECGICTGEDKAIEQMEKGICEAERNYGD